MEIKDVAEGSCEVQDAALARVIWEVHYVAGGEVQGVAKGIWDVQDVAECIWKIVACSRLGVIWEVQDVAESI